MFFSACIISEIAAGDHKSWPTLTSGNGGSLRQQHLNGRFPKDAGLGTTLASNVPSRKRTHVQAQMMAAKSAPLRFPSVKIICNMCRRPSSMRHQFLWAKVVRPILRKALIDFLELPNFISTAKDVKMN